MLFKGMQGKVPLMNLMALIVVARVRIYVLLNNNLI